MSSRVRLVQSVVLASIALAISSCTHEKLGSGTQALAVALTPSPAGLERLNGGAFEQGSMDIVTLLVQPVDPNAATIYDGVVLIFKQSTPWHLDVPTPVAYAEIALPTGTYKVTSLVITHPALTDDDVPPPPVPTDAAHCMAGVIIVNAENVGATRLVAFDETAGITFTVAPGQSTLAIKLDMPNFIKAYEAAFTCQVGCGTNDPTQNCITAPFNETAFRNAVLAYLTIE